MADFILFIPHLVFVNTAEQLIIRDIEGMY